MAGHNKWSKIKRLKGALDAKRGQVFSRFAKEITLAARSGGGDPATNHRLRTALLAARNSNMPNDSIERAIKRGTGEGAGGQLEELLYEGYAPGGVAILIEAATDNKNRTAADLRNIFSKHGGSLASSGSVAYLFHHKGQIHIPLSAISEDALLELAIEAGADELASDEDGHTVTTAPVELYAVADALRHKNLPIEQMRLLFLPSTTVTISDEHQARQVVHLCDALEGNDDVQNVYSNCDLPESILAHIAG